MRRLTEAEANPITATIVGAAVEVHRTLGPGLLESAYEAALGHELGLRGLAFTQQVQVPLRYKEAAQVIAYVADFIVEDAVVLELKAVESSSAAHKRQLLT